MRFLILFLFLFFNNCLNAQRNYAYKELVFPSLYCLNSQNKRVFDQNIKLEKLDGKCIKEHLVLSFEETNESICTLYVNGKEVKKGHILGNGSYEIKLQIYKNGLTKTKAIFLKIDKEG